MEDMNFSSDLHREKKCAILKHHRRNAEKIQKNAECLLKPKKIILTTNIEKGIIKGDMDLLQSLFLNLIDNARKACSEGGRIILEGQDYGGEYKFYVKKILDEF